ncbi:MAG TPA: PQQ-dependent sugar dehydrogenase [Steroidobacteraceae bacterium]|nr:PQQ-dependent sugar dehydrogenase [Steroidobacteraceae bacterium]
MSMKLRRGTGFVSLLLLSSFATLTSAATVPAGFDDSPFVQLPSDATAMQFAPDGRLFVCQQSGKLRVVLNGTLLSTPFLTLPVDAAGERGLLGVALDPDFERNQYVYVHYTATAPTIHNRVSRFTANGNVAVPGSEVVLLNLDPLSTARNHNGGALHFGNDGKLYVAVGDNANPDNAQLLGNPFGKVLRINRDGSIPADNPFVDRTSGIDRAIWALGLRNPFTMAFQRSSGRLLINDVGQQTFEEINTGVAGANYGWPAAEGPSSNPAYADPLHYYGHADGSCAVTGGTFYEPNAVTFPGWNFGKYFFADYCGGWIRRLNPDTGAITDFATGVAGPVDLKVGPDGALYYLARNAAVVGRIGYDTAQSPSINLQPASRTVAVGQSVTFKVGATGSSPLAYQWRRNGTPITGATAASYTRSNVQLLDDGAGFDVVVTNAFGRATSATARLTVLQETVPTASITRPVAGTRYTAGSTIAYAGTGNDVEDGVLPASAFTWWVNLHHDGHTHPLVLPVSGSKSGSFTIPATGETSANVFYRIHLRVRDSAGLTRSVRRDVLPRKSTVTLASNPTGLKLKLDGQAVTTPYRFVGVVGMQRKLEAVSPQSANGASWTFQGWSDGGARIHTIRTPGTDTTYTARFTSP